MKMKTDLRRRAALLLLAVLCSFTGAWAVEVEIGNNGSTSSSYTFPVNMYYNYSLTQQLYTAAEIGMAGTITSISFDYVQTAGFSCEGVQVYMKNVDKEEFGSITDMVAVSSTDLVWEGTFQADEDGWVKINLDTPFAYDGTSNLLVCLYDPTYGYPGSSFRFRTTDTTPYFALAYYSDSYVPDLSDVSTYSGYKSRPQSRANIKLDITPISNSILVNDGTDKNGYVPIYGLYCDEYSKSQFIIPAADLAAMKYGNITNLTFYAESTEVGWGSAEFEVYMTEVPGTTFSDNTLLDWSDMVKVMNAGTLAISDNKMEITLDDPYQYLGGNLLIGVNQTKSGTYKSCSWQGVSSSENVALGGYEGSINYQKFLPKTTIDYTPGTAPSVLKPTNLAVSEIGTRSAKLSWKQNGTADKWMICFVDAEDNITRVVIADSNPFTLTGLTPETTYTIRIIAVKGTDESLLSQKISFTTPTATPIPTDLAVSNVSPTNATATWNGSAENYDIEWAKFNSSADWLQYDDGNHKSDIGSSSANEWTWGVMYPASMLTGKKTLTKIAFYEVSDFYFTDGSVTMKVYSGGDTAPSTLIYTETIATANTDGMREVTLSAPVEFNASQNLWITLTANATYCMSMSNVDGGENSRWFFYEDEWIDFGTVYSGGADDSFMIWGYVDNMSLSSLSWSTESDVNSPYIINGLSQETDYIVRVRGDFGSDGNSNWTYTYFTTTSTNPTPTNVEADLMANSADLTWTGNGDSYNVRYRTAESREYLFFEDFENVTGDNLPSGWTEIDADGDGNTWFSYSSNDNVDNYGNLRVLGATCATSASYDNSTNSALTPDNWLISPQLDLQGSLSVWLRGQDPDWAAEKFAIYVSTTGTDVTDFVELVPKTVAEAKLTEYTANLSSYSGQKGYIAIRHFDITDQFRINVDNFGIYNATPAGSWTTASTNDATFTLSGLATNTAYDYQIQSVRGGSTSAWTDIQSFALLTLPSDADNTNLVVNNAGRQAHVTITGNTLYKDATYNTMCLPVDLNVEDVPFADATIKILDNSASSYDDATKTLTLTFKALTGNVIPAGTPFLVKWATGSNITDPYFVNGTVSMANSWAFTGGKFTGNIRPVTLSGKNMYFGSDKPLMWPNANASVNAFKACVIPANDDVARIIIDFGDGTELSVTTLKGDANGDNNVSITDAVAVVNFILGNPSGGFNKATANVNGDVDGEGNPVISITDAVGVVNIILGGGSGAPSMPLETNEVIETNEAIEDPQ